jgi:hypothetical protein
MKIFFSIAVVFSEENTSARGVPHVAKHNALHVLRTHMLQTNRTLAQLSETSEVLSFHYLQSSELQGQQELRGLPILKDKCVDVITELILYWKDTVPSVAAKANNVTSLP